MVGGERAAEVCADLVGVEVGSWREWICEQLAVDPRIESQRLREMAAELGMSAASRSLMGSCGGLAQMPGARRLPGMRIPLLTPAAVVLAPGFRGRWHVADAASLRPRSTNQILQQATSGQLPALLRFEDRNSMAHSIEARVPFLDHRLVEFAFKLPGEEKISGATTKHVLRKGLAGVVPEVIRTRTDKIGFRADPHITWRFATLHRDALLQSRTEFEERWFDRAALTRLLNSSDRSTSSEFALWRVISVKLWLDSNWSSCRDWGA